MPNSWFALHGLAPPQLTVCAVFCSSNSRRMHLFQAPLDTCLDNPLLCQPLSSRFAFHGLRAFDPCFLVAFLGCFSVGGSCWSSPSCSPDTSLTNCATSNGLSKAQQKLCTQGADIQNNHQWCTTVDQNDPIFSSGAANQFFGCAAVQSAPA